MSDPWKRKEIIGGQTLYLGDCREIMPVLGRFDAACCDPPYGIGESSAKVASRGKLAVPIDYGNFNWDERPASAEQISMIRASSKHQIIWGGNYFEGLGPTSCWLVWDKQNGDNDFADCELAWTNLQKAVRRIYWRWNGMIRKGDDVRVHPTQKPVGVMEWCISHLPETAKTILDPFAGSGTVAVACQRMGRNSTSIEIDEDYFNAACKRVDEAARQPDLLIPSPTHATHPNRAVLAPHPLTCSKAGAGLACDLDHVALRVRLGVQAMGDAMLLAIWRRMRVIAAAHGAVKRACAVLMNSHFVSRYVHLLLLIHDRLSRAAWPRPSPAASCCRHVWHRKPSRNSDTPLARTRVYGTVGIGVGR